MDKLINTCVNKMQNYGVIDIQQRSVMIYGLDLLMSSALSLMSVLIISIFMTRTSETSVLLLAFIPLQSFGGGYHCQTHLRCWLAMLIGFLISMTVLVHFPAHLLWFITVLASIPIFLWAPVENKKAPFGKQFGQKMRKIVIIVYCIAITVAFITIAKFPEISKPILIAIILSGFSITSAIVKKIFS